MTQEFGTAFTGWLFVAAGAMLWMGWMFLPHRIGTYFVPEDFTKVRAHLWLWIWIYRVHIFGMVTTAMAMFALAALLTDLPVRVMIWPGAGVAAAGSFVSALAAAFYYHHGAWGAIALNEKNAADALKFVENLEVDTEYVTCLVRFGRVFSGLGMLVLGLGLMKWELLPVWSAGGAALLGILAMAITMCLPARLSLYMPIFHLNALWLAATGIQILRNGMRLLA